MLSSCRLRGAADPGASRNVKVKRRLPKAAAPWCVAASALAAPAERLAMRSAQQPVSTVVRALKSLSAALSKKLADAKSDRDLQALVAEHPPLGPVLKQLQIAIFRYLSAPERARQTIAAHPELLTEEADALLLLLSEAQTEQRVKHAMRAGIGLLRRCRRDGIDSAFPA